MPEPTIEERVQAIQEQAIIIDGHSDILMAVAEGRMRLGDRFPLPDPNDWEAPLGWRPLVEATMYGFTDHTAYFQTMGHYDLPRLREGGVTVQTLAIYLDSANLDRALHHSLRMVACLEREYDENPDFAPVTSVDDIRRSKQEGKIGGLLAFEGFEPLGSDLDLLTVFYKLGLRMASLTHNRRNYFADGTQPGVKTTGLTAAGRDAVRRMNELGIVIDLAHLAPQGCWEVLELSEAPVILSHARPRRAFRGDPTANGGGDDAKKLVEAIAATGGLVGIIAWSQPDLAALLDDIETIIDLVGPDHVGLGSDFFGLEAAPKGFAGMHELPNVTRGLVERGHSNEVIGKILGGNYLRVFEQVWH
jgi:membrane dipeptidase